MEGVDQVGTAAVIKLRHGRSIGTKFFSFYENFFARKTNPCRFVHFKMAGEIIRAQGSRRAVSADKSATVSTVQCPREGPQRDLALHAPRAGWRPLLGHCYSGEDTNQLAFVLDHIQSQNPRRVLVVPEGYPSFRLQSSRKCTSKAQCETRSSFSKRLHIDWTAKPYLFPERVQLCPIRHELHSTVDVTMVQAQMQSSTACG